MTTIYNQNMWSVFLTSANSCDTTPSGGSLAPNPRAGKSLSLKYGNIAGLFFFLQTSINFLAHFLPITAQCI